MPPQRAHALIKNALVTRCRTRVLADYPKPIGAACYYGDFVHEPLRISFHLAADGADRTRVDAVIGSDGNTNRWLHARRREELRALMEYLVTTSG